MDNNTADNALAEMKRNLESERKRRGYDLDTPFETIGNKNSTGQMVFSIVLVVFLVTLVVVTVSLIALLNAGYSPSFAFTGINNLH